MKNSGIRAAGLLATALLSSAACIQSAGAQDATGSKADPAVAADAATAAPDAAAPDAAAAAPDAAGAPGSGARDVGEIIVTAQKRSQRLSDVPLSITALTGDQLVRQGVNSAADLEKVVPGFTFRESQNGTPVYSIRGIGFYDEQLAVAPAATIYTDQIPLPYGRMAEGASLDMERVEVMKGPQGTLFGQNSTAGAINYIAAKPTDTLAGGADLNYGRFNEIDVGGFISGPITDNLKVRLAIHSEERDAWQQSLTRNDTLGVKDFQTGRLLVDWNPIDRLKVEFNVNGWLDRSDTQADQARGYLPVSAAPPLTPVTQAIATGLINYPYLKGNDNQIADWDAGRNFRRNDNFYQTAIRADYDATDQLHLVSITSYDELAGYSPIDADGTPVAALFVLQTGHIRTFAQEFRIEGTNDPFKWVVGADYDRNQTRETQFTTIQGSNSQAPAPGGGFIHFDGINLINNENIQDVAGFGNLEYKLTDTVTLQGAIRYTSETLDFTGCMADGGGPLGFRIALNPSVRPGGCLTFLANGQSGAYNAPLDEDNISWRGGVNWKATPDTLIYANVTKGYKSGSFGTLPAVFFTQFKPVSQESVQAYETGFKTKILNPKMDISGAAFYYDYTNKQIQGYITVPPFGNLPFLVNVPKSQIEGLELDVTMHPLDSVKTTLGGTYLSTTVPDNAFVGSPFGGIINAKGESLPATPKWQIQGDIEYDFPVSSTVAGFVGGNFSYRSGTVAAFGSKTGPAGTQSFFDIPGYVLVDARIGVDINDKYTVELYGQNITNTQYWENVTHIYDTYDRVTGFPATYGIRASARF